MTTNGIRREADMSIDTMSVEGGAIVAALRTAVRGQVVGPGDDGYDEARAVFYGGFDARPVAIARPLDAEDVAAVVRHARDTGLELAVRSGGHSAVGHGTTDGGILLDLGAMRRLDIDLETRTAWAETGLTAGEVTQAAAEQGLAIGFGDTGSVGIGGITLGGGVGYLVRTHGLTIDNLLAAEIVTADGRILAVDASNEPDLFWAIRGGGGNFGVATRFRYGLHPLPQAVGGVLVLPASERTIAGFMAASQAAPDELSAIANVMPCPPMPFVPEERHGELVILALVCYAGDAAAADPVLAPLRALATPIADLVRPIAYPEMYPPEDESYHPTAVGRTLFVDRVDDDVATTILDALAASDASLRAVQLRTLGGAMARVPEDATAFAPRTRGIMVNVAAFYDGEADRPAREAWVTNLVDVLGRGDDAAYVNFLGVDDPDRVRAAYPGPTWDRLRAIKARYDPTNLFRRNHNVPPAGDDA
jgi:FAD/FMN-containing dehydrogenase